jgi:Ca2+-binding RTX toxin-like protein
MPVSTASTFVEIFGAFDMKTFFAPSSTPIISITGGETSVRVTLQSGVVLVYEGSGLTFNGTQPTGGTVTSVSALDGTGAVLAKLSLSEAPWNFAEIQTNLPRQSYLATSHTIADAFAFSDPIDNSASNIFGGNQADEFAWFNGADTIRGLDGDDLFFTSDRFGSSRPAGTVIDGGAGNDTIFVTPSGTRPPSALDLTQVDFRSIEGIALVSSVVRISAAQIGCGQIASDAVLLGAPDSMLQIDQVVGSTVNVAGFQKSRPDQSLEGVAIKVIGTSENDRQIGSNDLRNQLEGFAGNDTLRGGANGDTIFGGTGDDRLFAGGTNPQLQQSDELYGGDGDDRLIGAAVGPELTEMLFGGNGNDTIISGEEFGSLMEGGAGDDFLQSKSTFSPDFFPSGSLMLGGDGNDTLVGSPDNTDEMFGGVGDDLYRVNNSFAFVQENVGEGYDRLVTSVDIDLSGATFAPDAGEIERISVSGTAGLNVSGTASNNVIVGNAGADTLIGAAGDDRLLGRDGADVLSGGTGQDSLRGGSGEDTFVFVSGFGKDTVLDFIAGTDVVDLAGFDAVTSFDDLLADHATQVGRNVLIEGDNGDLLVLRDVSLSTLTADDFLF